MPDTAPSSESRCPARVTPITPPRARTTATFRPRNPVEYPHSVESKLLQPAASTALLMSSSTAISTANPASCTHHTCLVPHTRTAFHQLMGKLPSLSNAATYVTSSANCTTNEITTMAM